MRLYIAGLESALNYKHIQEYVNNILNDFYFLSSFYYAKNNNIKDIINRVDKNNFLLDSGAFTFMQKGIDLDINQYTQDYIDFINKYNIKYFFEMDVDSILGYEKVKELRYSIEKGTGKKCIPVWHASRGIEEFKKHCEEYDYVAIGSEDSKKVAKVIKQLIKYANKNNVKIHMLGYNKKDMIELDAYSYDATTWNGGMYGSVFSWSVTESKPIRHVRELHRRIKSELLPDLYLHNLKVWKQYQSYLKYQGFWRYQ